MVKGVFVHFNLEGPTKIKIKIKQKQINKQINSMAEQCGRTCHYFEL